jgi:hypothetical protein
LDLFFIDYDMTPLLVYENYLSCKPNLESLVKASDHISISDILEKRIRSKNEWSLLQNRGIHSCVAVGSFAGSGIPFPKFPE